MDLKTVGFPSPKSPDIEIEQKFLVPDDVDDRLLAPGFMQSKSEEKINDIYFDTDEFQLLLKDNWLRKRNGIWELKHPMPLHDHFEKSTVYQETHHPEDILKIIQKISSKLTESPTLEDLVDSGLLSQLANIKSCRKSFKRDNLNVTIDVTDWGFRIGEVEVVVHHPEQVNETLEVINEFSNQMGFSKLRTGKVNDNLRKFHPTAYEILTKMATPDEFEK